MSDHDFPHAGTESAHGGVVSTRGVEATAAELEPMLSAAEVSRRTFLGGLGLGFLAIACGMPTNSSSSTASATGSSSTTLSGAGSVPAAQRIPVEVLQRLSTAYNGMWKGRWITDRGQGTSTVQLDIDIARRVATMQLTTGGIPFGHAPLPPASVEVRLDGYSIDQADISEKLNGLGTVEIHRQGGGRGTGTLSQPLHDPSVQRLDVTASFVEGSGADITYECTLRDGTTTVGACRWTRRGDAVPPLPSRSAIGLEAFVHGDYAAGLLTATELGTALGRDLGPLMANGGRANYGPGVDVSNARAAAPDGALIVQVRIYRLASPAAALAYFNDTLAVGAPPSSVIPGLGDRAFVQPSVPDVLVVQGREIADIQVLTGMGLDVGLEKSVAWAILARLGR